MPHSNPALDRTGKPQSFKTAVASKLNWMRRMAMGAQGNIKSHHNFYWIRRHSGYLDELTPEQRDNLFRIEQKLVMAAEALKSVEEAIDEYYKAPKMPSPSRERWKVARKAKIASPSP